MSATLSVEAESNQTTRLSNPKVDNPTPVNVRLRRLAIVHQRAAVSRAMRLAGIHGRDKPTLDDLARAEDPIAPRWRWVKPPPPTEADIRAAAAATVRTPSWRMAQDMLTSIENQGRAAMPHATRMLFAAWTGMPEHKMANTNAWEAGQRHAERWRLVLDVLAAMLNAVDVRVPDAWLSAISEADLKTAAAVAAQLGFITTPVRDMDTPDAKRARCPMHHRRVLRRRAATARQHLAALLGTIGAGGAPYADHYAVTCWRERQAAAEAFGLARVLLFEDGQQVPLWGVMESSRKARLAALYAQTLGLDELADRRGLLPVFITMTLPPQHHPNPQHGQPYAGLEWEDAPCPGETDAAMGGLWRLLRARLAANDIDLLGLRVVEPHQDGCPHLHALLYLQDEAQAERLDWHIQELCPEPVKGKRIASKLMTLDRTKAKPATYVMKYLLKCLPAGEAAAAHADGTITDGDPDHLAHHAEVQAWASERRLRRFAWLGLHGIRTTWQRIRAMTDDEIEHAPDAMQEAAHAMRTGAWADALEAMGAIRADGRERVRLTYATKENAYGEDVKRPHGLAMGDWHMPLCRRACKIVRPQKTPHDRTPLPSAGQESNKGFTVTVSCPREATDGGVDDGGTGRTGPPDSTSQDGTSAHPLEPELTNNPQTRERPSHDRTLANKRPPLAWTPGMFRARTTDTMPPMPDKMRPRMRLRTEMDDVDLAAMAVPDPSPPRNPSASIPPHAEPGA